MKRTAFYAIHQSLGARIVPFAGFEMPVQYAGIIQEHRCVRTSVGMFDVSHMGEFEVRGKDAAEFVQQITINDVSKLVPGKVQYSAMCYPDGGIIDDLLVYRMEDRFFLVVNASNTEKDFTWIEQHRSGDVELADRSDEISLLAIQGPDCIQTLQKLTNVSLSEIPYYNFVQTELAGVEMIVSRTGYTGELGMELYFPSEVATGEQVWQAVMEAGKEFGIQPIGLGARDTLRLEMGFRLYGNDIDQTTNPLEAGLGWITKLGKGDFIGRDALLKIKQEGLKRQLVGFVAEGRAVARHGYEVRKNGSTVGMVTSGTFSPSLERNIGMAYVDAKSSGLGDTVSIPVRNAEVQAKITEIPFLKK